MTKEQETAMYDQPDDEPRRPYTEAEMKDLAREDGPWWEEVRAVGKRYGFHFDTLTLNGDTLDVKVDPGPQLPVSDFGRIVLGFLSNAGDVYKERNALYQDNFRVVGRVMEALFPNGAPPLHDAHDYNRWHIFELAIVKITRYVANWGNPDPDSLVDLLPYISILAAQDVEMREREARFAADEAKQAELVRKLKESARGAGLFTYHEDSPEAERDEARATTREEDNEARMYSEDEAFERAFGDD